MGDSYNELTHHGILGMKWGIRRYRNEDGSLTQKGKEREINRRRKQDLKNRKSLSYKELNRKLDRLEKEKKLRELTNEDVRPGQTFAKDVLKNAGKKAAVAVASGAAIYGVKVLLTKKFSLKELASFATPKPKQ